MKRLYVDGEIYGEAERIVRTNTDIIGYNGDKEVFVFRGINDFSKFRLDEGQTFDVDPILQIRADVDYIGMMAGVL